MIGPRTSRSPMRSRPSLARPMPERTARRAASAAQRARQSEAVRREIAAWRAEEGLIRHNCVMELRTVDGRRCVLRLYRPGRSRRDQRRWDEASRARFDPETTPPPTPLPAFDNPCGAWDSDTDLEAELRGRVRARGRRRGRRARGGAGGAVSAEPPPDGTVSTYLRCPLSHTGY